MSPEQLEQKGYDHKVDVFAFGALLWELYAEEVPFDGLEVGDVKNKVLAGSSLPQKSMIPHLVYDLVDRCRSMKPDFRPEFKELVSLLKKI